MTNDREEPTKKCKLSAPIKNPKNKKTVRLDNDKRKKNEKPTVLKTKKT